MWVNAQRDGRPA